MSANKQNKIHATYLFRKILNAAHFSAGILVAALHAVVEIIELYLLEVSQSGGGGGFSKEALLRWYYASPTPPTATRWLKSMFSCVPFTSFFLLIPGGVLLAQYNNTHQNHHFIITTTTYYLPCNEDGYNLYVYVREGSRDRQTDRRGMYPR